MFNRDILSLVVAAVGAGIVSLSLLLVVITIALAFVVLMIILGIILLHARQRKHPIQATNDNEDGKSCFVFNKEKDLLFSRKSQVN